MSQSAITPSKTLNDLQCACQRCGYTWLPRIVDKPKRCPRCTSHLWATPRKDHAPSEA